ncbi:mutS protein homolog 5-like [Bacillus rossius redtenbacheri]|uniref:mutS protein homolog 5-like n=1 Tax=Bacillus rossius redtenbacheri TaxID=93214 RepID=UPI002FDEF16E
MSETLTSVSRSSVAGLSEESVEDLNEDETSVQDDVQHLSSSDAHPNDVILCVVWKRGMLGAASYSVETSEVSVLADIVDVNPDFNMLKSLYYQVQPSKVVTLYGLAEPFTSAVRALVTPGDEGGSATSGALIFLPSKECKLQACRARVMSLRLPSEPADASEDEHERFLQSVLNLGAETMVTALGTLLRHLDAAWPALSLTAEASAPVLLLTNMLLSDIVTMDAETYEALQVFSHKMHPSCFKMWSPSSDKEGLSVYGLFNRCRSRVGSNFMKVMFLHPTRDVGVLNGRLDVVQFCMQPRSDEVVKNMTQCLKHVRSVAKIVTILSKQNSPVRDWKILHRTIYHLVLLHELCSRYKDEAALFTKIASFEMKALRKVSWCITRIIDFPDSEKQKRLTIQLGIDSELDRKKQEHGGLRNVLSRMAEMELEDLPAYIQTCSTIYVPEIGFLIAVPFWAPNLQDTDLQIPGLEFMFIASEVAHFKSPRCRELDATLGDMMVSIVQHEKRLIRNLVEYVREKIVPLHEMVQLAAELDCLVSMSTVARENGYCRPALRKEQMLEIKDGRHPLQELCIDNFVPNDTCSGGTHSLMKVLTGPNASGKSVYLKQVALISYMAHIGSYVPASSATIGILDHIHSRIQTVESIASQLSAFIIDLQQMSLSLYCSTPSSLVVIDEFGKGTAELDGLALLTACLRHYLSRGSNCPHVLVSTHFHQITTLLPASPLLSFQTLEYVLSKDEDIVCLFKLKDGSVESSFSLAVLEAIGGSKETVQQAAKVLKAFKQATPMVENHQSKISQKKVKYIELANKLLTSELDETLVSVLNKDLNLVSKLK